MNNIGNEKCAEATPRETLLAQLMNPNVPKNEREWVATKEIEELQAFARAVMEGWPMIAPGGGEIQDAAEKHGLLRPETRHAPCTPDGEGCTCAEYASQIEFADGLTCYRKTARLLGYSR